MSNFYYFKTVFIAYLTFYLYIIIDINQSIETDVFHHTFRRFNEKSYISYSMLFEGMEKLVGACDYWISNSGRCISPSA